jgi:hypothetical protein
MNKQNKKSDDILNRYINSEVIEKAPYGFTARVMRSVQFEPIPLRTAHGFVRLNMIPVISVSVTILLILAAILLPGNETGKALLPAVNIFKNIKVSLPGFDLNSIFRFNFPALVVYIFIGILILTFFDRALNVFFHQKDGQL